MISSKHLAFRLLFTVTAHLTGTGAGLDFAEEQEVALGSRPERVEFLVDGGAGLCANGAAWEVLDLSATVSLEGTSATVTEERRVKVRCNRGRR